MFLTLRVYPMVLTPAIAWYRYWGANSNNIVFLAAVNTTLTAGSEITSRAIIPKIKGLSNEGFIVTDPDGISHIHRQSLINILMTLAASLLGGPVYFITRRTHRFIFFVTFGIFNSYLAQLSSSILLEGYLHIAGRRLLFDFLYNSSLKFFMFEYVRPFLLRHRDQPLRVIGFRVGQDFLTSSIRIVILYYLKLRG